MKILEIKRPSAAKKRKNKGLNVKNHNKAPNRMPG